ncbi:kmo [Symbiodinium natans]|uniref:Kmo protein n=1 Tax=Symbiodinium natans TaxID=878477 RepID=A0A812PRA3_9DINO|nr:kmo [Symbiodinium natans]
MHQPQSHASAALAPWSWGLQQILDRRCQDRNSGRHRLRRQHVQFRRALPSRARVRLAVSQQDVGVLSTGFPYQQLNLPASDGMGDEQVSLAAGTGLVAIAGFLILRALRQRRKQEEFMARTADDVHGVLALSSRDGDFLQNQVQSSPSTASERFDYETLESGSYQHEHTFKDWMTLESMAASASMGASFSNPQFCRVAHQLLTRDGLVVLSLQTVKDFATRGSDGFQDMLEMVFQGTAVILPLEDNHVKRSNTRISTFHLDEVPGKSVNEAKHLLVNVWFPCPDCAIGRKRLAIGRGRAFRAIEAAEKLKVYGPGPRIPRSQPTVNYCLSPEGAEKLAAAGDLAFTPGDSLVVFLSGTTSSLPVPICPHAGALPGSSQEFRYYVYARNNAS